MGFVDYLILAVILGILGLAGWYVYRAKKSGQKCIGCPNGGKCSGNCACCEK